MILSTIKSVSFIDYNEPMDIFQGWQFLSGTSIFKMDRITNQIITYQTKMANYLERQDSFQRWKQLDLKLDRI